MFVQKGEANITLDNLYQREGHVTPVIVTTDPEGLEVRILYDGIETLPQTVGKYLVEAVVEDVNYAGSEDATLVLTENTAEPPADSGDSDNTGADDVQNINGQNVEKGSGKGDNTAVNTGDSENSWITVWGIGLAVMLVGD